MDGAIPVIQPPLWNVKGGNQQVPERLIKHSKANVIHSKVESVTKLKRTNGTNEYSVSSGVKKETYDVLIVAAPLEKDMSDIKFINFDKAFLQLPGTFHRTVATFIKGMPNLKYFGFTNVSEIPPELLTVNDKLFFNSIERQFPTDPKNEGKSYLEEDPVWKVLSQNPLSDDQIETIFQSVVDKKVISWKAYPNYHSNEKNIPPFKLDDNLYYVNAIEWLASLMEMSVIGGINVANLAYNEWIANPKYIDQ